MPRKPAHEPITSVNFRMPDSLLQKIDEFSYKHHLDRTAEINTACRYWVEIGGEASPTTLSNEIILEFGKKIDTLTDFISKQMAISSSEIAEMKAKIDSLTKELAEEKKQLLRIIEEGVKRS